jgi:hypothetical protein
LFVASDKWREDQVVYAKKPATVGSVVAMVGRVKRDEPIDLDVSTVVRGPGTYNFALLASSKNRVRYRSREAADSPPTLLLTLRERPAEPRAAAVPDAVEQGDAARALATAMTEGDPP